MVKKCRLFKTRISLLLIIENELPKFTALATINGLDYQYNFR